MSVRIITDSASDITAEEIQDNAWPLEVLPLGITFGTTTYQDGVDLSTRRFYELLIEGDDLPKTSQVTPFAFGETIRRAREAGDEALVITVSSELSGTYESAIAAASEAGEGVWVVDSRNVTVGERVLVEYALGLVAEGRAACDIASELERVREDISVVALLDTLEYLRRGGRVPAAAAAVGQLLAIKPVVAVEDGKVVILGKARGSKSGRNLLTQQVERAGGIDFTRPLALGYAGLDDTLLRKYIADSRTLWEGHVAEGELPVHVVGPTIGTHVGPGAIALAFFHKG